MALSFSAAAKEEVCRSFPHSHCCALAQCFGILLFGNSFGVDGIRIITESRDFAYILPKLFKKAFDVQFDSYPSLAAPGKLVFQIWEEEIRSLMKELQTKRTASQPLDLPSAGSAFKRPVGGYAAALIDQAGLKGFRVGGAAISEKHAGFAVNLGGATAADVKQLLRQVSDRVYETSSIRIEPEVRIW